MAIFTNQAILSYNNTQVISNIAQGEIQEVLTLSKTAAGSSYSQGDSITYILSLVNAGQTPLTGLTVTDDLGGYTLGNSTVYPLTYQPDSLRYFLDGLLQPPPAVQSATPLTFTGISVGANGNSTLVYRVTVNGYAPLGPEAVLTNSATVSGTGITTVTADASIAANTEPDLTVTKSITPIPVTENSRVTYTFLIQNYGSRATELGDNVSLQDTFDPFLTQLNVTLNGTALTENEDYTYSPSGQFVTLPGKITVPAATYVQNPATGVISVQPGTALLTVSGIL